MLYEVITERYGGMKIARKPEWLQKQVRPAAHAEMERLLEALRLNTVCREARCPNRNNFV